jgi:putative transposase
MQMRLSGHSVYRTQYHIVIVTKYRRRALNPVKFRQVADYHIREIAGTIEGVEVEELNIQPDHVHMMIIIPPRYSVSKVVEIIKSQSTRRIRKEIPWLDKVSYRTNALWTVGYFVSTVGIDEEIIRRYVKYQTERDSGQAKLDL